MVVHEVAREGVRMLPRAVGPALYGTWLLFLLLSSAYFAGGATVRDSCLFMVAFSAAMLVGAVAGRRRGVQRRGGRLCRGLSFVLGMLSLGTSLVLADPTAAACASGVLAGAGAGAALTAAFDGLARLGRELRFCCAAEVAAAAAVCFEVLAFVVPPAWYRAALLVVLAAGWAATAVAASGAPRVAAALAGSADEAPAPQGGSDRGSDPGAALGAGRQAGLRALAVLAGFLPFFSLGLWPKSAHFAGVYSDALFGGVSAVAAAIPLVCAAVMVAFALLLAMGTRGVPLAAAGAVVLLAVVCTSLPAVSLGDVLHMPVILSFACLAGACAATAYGAGMARRPGGFLGWWSLGACIASAIAYGFIGMNAVTSKVLGVMPALVSLGVALAMLLLFIYERAVLMEGLFGRPAPAAPPLAIGLADRCRALAAEHGLTARELEVLELYAQGRDVPYIEGALSISKSTAKTHTKHIYQKLGVSSRQELLDALQGTPRAF